MTLLWASAAWAQSAPSESLVVVEEASRVPFVMGTAYSYRTFLGGDTDETTSRIHDVSVSWRWGFSESIWLGGAFRGGGNDDFVSLRLIPLALRLEISDAGAVRPFLSIGVGMQMERRRGGVAASEEEGFGVSGFFASVGPGIVMPIIDCLELQAEIRIDVIQDDGQEGGVEIQSGVLLGLNFLFDS